MAPAARSANVEGSGVTLIVPVVYEVAGVPLLPVAQGRQGNLAERPGKLPVEQLERLARLRLEAVQELDIEIPARTNCPVTLIWSYWLPATGPANCITVSVELPR